MNFNSFKNPFTRTYSKLVKKAKNTNLNKLLTFWLIIELVSFIASLQLLLSVYDYLSPESNFLLLVQERVGDYAAIFILFIIIEVFSITLILLLIKKVLRWYLTFVILVRIWNFLKGDKK